MRRGLSCQRPATCGNLLENQVLSECLRCGYCCKTAACSFGESKPCRYLVDDRPGDYECGLYDFIVEQPDAEVAPAFWRWVLLCRKS